MFLRALSFRRDRQDPAVRDGARHAAILFLALKSDRDEAVSTFIRPLKAHLTESALGEIVGYRLRPGHGPEPRGIEVHLALASSHPRALQSIGNRMDDLEAPVGSTIEFTETGQRHLFGRTEGVAVDLVDHPAWFDLAEACTEALAGAGFYQGSRSVDGRRSLYFYGESAAAMNAAIGGAISPGVTVRRLT